MKRSLLKQRQAFSVEQMFQQLLSEREVERERDTLQVLGCGAQQHTSVVHRISNTSPRAQGALSCHNQLGHGDGEERMPRQGGRSPICEWTAPLLWRVPAPFLLSPARSRASVFILSPSVRNHLSGCHVQSQHAFTGPLLLERKHEPVAMGTGLIMWSIIQRHPRRRRWRWQMRREDPPYLVMWCYDAVISMRRLFLWDCFK